MASLLTGCANEQLRPVTDSRCLTDHYDGNMKHDMTYACLCDRAAMPKEIAKECFK